jgi:hypothetical protein
VNLESWKVPTMPMKPAAAILVVIAILAMSGCQGDRTSAIEQRVNRLEQRLNTLESERKVKLGEDADKRVGLEKCLADANSAYDQNIALNGTKTARGGYNLPVAVASELLRQKQDKLEECKVLYSR